MSSRSVSVLLQVIHVCIAFRDFFFSHLFYSLGMFDVWVFRVVGLYPVFGNGFPCHFWYVDGSVRVGVAVAVIFYLEVSEDGLRRYKISERGIDVESVPPHRQAMTHGVAGDEVDSPNGLLLAQ